jgi:hypothetical protein
MRARPGGSRHMKMVVRRHAGRPDVEAMIQVPGRNEPRGAHDAAKEDPAAGLADAVMVS